MTDRLVGALAVAVWAAAYFPLGEKMWPVGAAALVAAGAWRTSRPWLLIAAAVVMASFGAGAAWARIGDVQPARYEGVATLVSDPAPTSGGVRVVAQIEGHRYDLRAWGSPAGRLRNRLMGERIELTAKLRPLSEAPDWLRARGISGRGTVTAVQGFQVGVFHTRLANSIRRTIESGASSLDRDDQALFAGLVYGDDRSQSPLTADNFDAAGLTHLLAVSGQNVAFVLAIAGPVLRRLGYRQRFAFVVAVLLLFATVTRFEASVVRASVMTAVAAVAALVGTEASGRRVLALAIAGLILVDPLMVHSVAFQLSAAASAGILFWSGRVARALPGPRVFAEAAAVTSTAQLAVAPLLVWHFDGLPVASLPANLLAGPAAGPVMMWGLTGGLVAGLVPDWIAMVLHLPTKLALWWIDSVAAIVPQVPLGRLGAVHIAALFVLGWWGLRQATPARRAMTAAALVVALLHPAVVLSASPAQTQTIDHDSTIWRDEQTTIVELDAGSRPETVLSSLRRANVGAIDLLIARQSSYSNASLIDWIRTHHQITSVWAPEPTMGVGEVVPEADSQLLVDGVVLHVSLDDDRLEVHAERAVELDGVD